MFQVTFLIMSAPMQHELNNCFSSVARPTFIALIAFSFSFSSCECYGQRDSLETIEKIRDKGVSVHVDDDGRVTEVNAALSDFTNEDMGLLAGLTGIADLNLNCQFKF